MIQFTINGVSSEDLKAYMGKGFLNNITNIPEKKKYISVESRLENGKRLFARNTKIKDRELSLPFVIIGRDPAECAKMKNLFIAEIMKSECVIHIPAIEKSYTLVYQGPTTEFVMNKKRSICQFTCKFIEPCPSIDGSFTLEVYSSEPKGGKVYIDSALISKKAYTYGTLATLRAQPADGYIFKEWSDGDAQANRVLSVTENIRLYAIFQDVRERYTITAKVNGTGQVKGTGEYNRGDTAILEAQPAGNFVEWDDGETDNPREVVVLNDGNVTASFSS